MTIRAENGVKTPWFCRVFCWTKYILIPIFFSLVDEGTARSFTGMNSFVFLLIFEEYIKAAVGLMLIIFIFGLFSLGVCFVWIVDESM